MIKDIIVLDSVMPKQYQDFLEEELTGGKIPWHFRKDITFDEVEREKNNIKTLMPAFAHRYYEVGDGVLSPFYALVLPVAYDACEQVGYKLKQILAVRSFLTFPIPHIQSTVDHPHVDRKFDNLNIIYYVNDADGDTVFYDKTFRDIPPEVVKREDLTVVKTVTPKKGQAVVFDGSYYHSATRPTDNYRCIINFGLI
jgi:hypothetical protein